jgi:hypothetical protein
MFLIFNVRERRHFWHSKPSKILLAAMVISIIVATGMVTVGIPDIKPVPLTQTLLIMSLSAVFSLVLNDFIKSLLVEKEIVSW